MSYVKLLTFILRFEFFLNCEHKLLGIFFIFISKDLLFFLILALLLFEKKKEKTEQLFYFDENTLFWEKFFELFLFGEWLGI